MRGRVLDAAVDKGDGLISGDDGKRYTFNSPEWKEPTPPVKGMLVDFETHKGEAIRVYRVSPPSGGKNKVAAGLLGIFLGGLGIHKFYLGYNGPGLVFLITNTIGFAITWIMLFLPNIVLGMIGLVEGIIYLTKTDEEFEQTYLVSKREWF